MADAVALRPPEGAISEIRAGLPVMQSLSAVQTALVDMIDNLEVNPSTQLGRMIEDSNNRLTEMLCEGGMLSADPQQLIASAKMLHEVRLRSLDLKRRCLESAMKAHQLLESKISLTMSLNSTGSGADIPSDAYTGAEPPAYEGGDGSSFTGILPVSPEL